MGNRRGLPTGSGWIDRQKLESIQGPNWITDNGYMEVNWEQAGHGVTGPKQCNGPRTNRF